jgi:hypothetical protein
MFEIAFQFIVIDLAVVSERRGQRGNDTVEVE